MYGYDVAVIEIGLVLTGVRQKQKRKRKQQSSQ